MTDMDKIIRAFKAELAEYPLEARSEVADEFIAIYARDFYLSPAEVERLVEAAG